MVISALGRSLDGDQVLGIKHRVGFAELKAYGRTVCVPRLEKMHKERYSIVYDTKYMYKIF